MAEIKYLPYCKHVPFKHQIDGVLKIVSHPYFALFDEMGAGKTAQAIIAAQLMFHRGNIDTVIVCAPANVRSVWYEQTLGELSKHLWDITPAIITEYHTRVRSWLHGPRTAQQEIDLLNEKNPLIDVIGQSFLNVPRERRMKWFITNFAYAREHFEELFAFTGDQTFFVIDESSEIKHHTSAQTKAAFAIRRKCARVLLLNGTPIANNPLDMYAQGNIMSFSILDVPSYVHYRARYCVVTTKPGFPKIIEWQNLDDLQRRFAPFVLRRLKKDCLDLPPKLDPIPVSVTLNAKTWDIYKSMRDDLIVYLSETATSTASQALIKVLRLAQITSGFLGGIEDTRLDDQQESDDDRPDYVPFITDPSAIAPRVPDVQEIGDEKLRAFEDWLDRAYDSDPKFKLIVWCRFKPEFRRALAFCANNPKYKKFNFGAIIGGQKRKERLDAKRLLDPRTSPDAPVLVFSTYAGSMGDTLTAAHTNMYLSRDYRLLTWLQSQDRTHRPTQVHAVSYFYMLTEGPRGQKTIEHTIAEALQGKQNIADWTTGAWVQHIKQNLREELERSA
jgi:SNF2 family DNA or RNA helicase